MSLLQSVALLTAWWLRTIERAFLWKAVGRLPGWVIIVGAVVVIVTSIVKSRGRR